MPFRAILFDIGGTLWHAQDAPPPDEFRRLAAERAASELQRLGLHHPDPGMVARAIWNGLTNAMRDARLGDLMEPDYASVSHAILAQLGLCLSVRDAGRLLEATYISGAEGGKAAFADARPTLLELRRRGFKLGIVTNRAFGGERFRADLHDAGLDIGWDAEAVSVEVGYIKPHPAIFRWVLERLHVEPQESLMVGDSLAEDIAGAQRLGIAAAWRRKEPDATGVIPDFEFDEVGELLQLPELARAVA